jgi:hypothetical protein
LRTLKVDGYGKSIPQLPEHQNWELFGLSRTEVLDRLDGVSRYVPDLIEKISRGSEGCQLSSNLRISPPSAAPLIIEVVYRIEEVLNDAIRDVRFCSSIYGAFFRWVKKTGGENPPHNIPSSVGCRFVLFFV